MRVTSLLAVLAVVAGEGGEDEAADPVPAKALVSKTLAPTVKYLNIHAFLHSYDSLPKVLLVLPEEEGGAAPAAPGW